MDLSGQADAQLTTIRTLLERATIYRAISVPGATVGGALALVAAWITRGTADHRMWLGVWLGVLLLASAFNFFQLARDARRENRAFLSNGLRLALRGLLPPLLAGGVTGLVCGGNGALELTAVLWMIFYGLALLAVREFAPVSLTRLGMVFLAAGLVGFSAIAFWPIIPPCWLPVETALASSLMGATFGIFHITYAAAVAFTRRA